MDSAHAHVKALEHLDDQSGMQLFNLGTGEGVSVLQLRAAFSAAAGHDIPYVMTGRRPGDVPHLVADTSAVHAAWGWKPTFDLTAMCRDSWRFQTANPGGYDS